MYLSQRCCNHWLAAQAKKVYVQDRIQETGDHIWDLLERGAHFYVCGDAAHMAGSVEKALLHIVEKVRPCIATRALSSCLT